MKNGERLHNDRQPATLGDQVGAMVRMLCEVSSAPTRRWVMCYARMLSVKGLVGADDFVVRNDYVYSQAVSETLDQLVESGALYLVDRKYWAVAPLSAVDPRFRDVFARLISQFRPASERELLLVQAVHESLLEAHAHNRTVTPWMMTRVMGQSFSSEYDLYLSSVPRRLDAEPYCLLVAARLAAALDYAWYRPRLPSGPVEVTWLAPYERQGCAR